MLFLRLTASLAASLVALLLSSCAHGPDGGMTGAPTGPAVSRGALSGVWEVVAAESLVPRQTGRPVMPLSNSKYCFNAREAYPDLAPDTAQDSADGGGDYHFNAGGVLVIRTGVPDGASVYHLELVSPEQLIWRHQGLRITLRRVALSWDGRNAPKLPRRDIPVKYPS